MNAKPLLSTIKARNSQMSVTDLKDAFKVSDCSWILFINRRNDLVALRDTEANRDNLRKNGFWLEASIKGVSRKSAIQQFRNSKFKVLSA